MDDAFSAKLAELSACFSQGSPSKLKEVGSWFAQHALAENDERAIALSVVSFALGKFFDKQYVVNAPDWKQINEKMKLELDLLGKSYPADLKQFDKLLSELLARADSLDTAHNRFVIGGIEKARLKAGAELYAHGASLGKAAQLSGAERIELAKYIGSTRMADKYKTMSVRERMAFAETLLR